jgi:hypothetical protein
MGGIECDYLWVFPILQHSDKRFGLVDIGHRELEMNKTEGDKRFGLVDMGQ